jgi:hypothetical protein
MINGFSFGEIRITLRADIIGWFSRIFRFMVSSRRFGNQSAHLD